MDTLSRILPLFIPFAAGWAAWHERIIRRHGQRLNADALLDAQAVGVRHPEKIRVLHVQKIPLLNGRLVRAISKFVPSVSPHTVGLSLRYGIYLRSSCRPELMRELIAHECAHTAQYELLGGFNPFMIRYFSECLEHGYHSAPLELEAVQKAASVISRRHG